MAYRNFNIQTRQSVTQPFYWEVRPFGNPHPTKCYSVENFLYETITWSADRLTKKVETVWVDKDAFLSTLPPDVFEQPSFQEWHDEHGLTFYIEEDENFVHDESRVGENQEIQLK